MNVLIHGQYLAILPARDRQPRITSPGRRKPSGVSPHALTRVPVPVAAVLGLLAAGGLGRHLGRRHGYWRRVVQDAPEGFIAIDNHGRIVEWNRACEDMFGWTPAQAAGCQLSELIIPEHLREAHERGVTRYLETGEAKVVGRPLVLPALRRDGAELSVELTIRASRRGGPGAFHAFVHDATARRRTERYLKAESEVARVLLEGRSLRGVGPQLLAVLGGALDWDAGVLWLVDEHEHVLRLAHTWGSERTPLRANLEVARRAALAPGEGVAGRVWQSLEPDWIDGAAAVRRQSALAGPELDSVCAILALPLLSRGRVLGVLQFFHGSPYPRDDELLALTMFVAMHIASYLDQLRGTDLLERSRTVARTDELTGLPNRRALNEQLPERMASAIDSERVLCLAMVDFDNFKAFNDDRGHPEGDRLLRESALAWSAELRDDDLLARYGGEEFTVILDAPIDQAHEILERVRAATPSGQTCSVGLTQWDRRESAEELIARADDALYRAKNAGRDRIELAPVGA